LVRQFLVSHEFGGAADIAVRIACALRCEHGPDVEMWLPGEGRAAQVVRDCHLPIRWYDMDAAGGRSWAAAAWANLRLAAQLSRRRRSIVHVHSPIVYGAFRRAFQIAGVTTVVHVHLDFSVDLLQWAFRHPPHAVISCARFLEERVRLALPGPAADRRMVVIPNAVDTTRFQPGDKAAARQALGAPLARPLVIMLANLAPHKGQVTAVRAVAELRRRGIEVSCWLAGVDRRPGAPFQSELTALIEELRVGDLVRLLGFRSDTPELLKAADLLLLPSTSEGLPLTLLEAQACHVPVIAAPTAGIPEIVIDGETGFLAPANDSDAYANRIELLLRDRETARRIAETAAARCRAEHNWETYHRQVRDLYAHLMAD
jgi:glycosyltransferase involved in cell wall biosynthesis